ncbi:MAG: hypothetical protein RL538_6 [Candidatus Parcubacteria bacterium]|jgi:hypothetical protein
MKHEFFFDTDKVSVLYMSNTVSIIENQDGTISVSGTAIHLRDQEKALLRYLIKGEGRVRTKAMFLSHLACGKNIDYKLIDVLVCKVRTKLRLAHPAAAELLRLVWGRGYAWGLPQTTPPTNWHPLVPNPGRWTIALKSDLIEALRRYDVEVDTVLQHLPDLSIEELFEWKRAYQDKGRAGLRTTRPDVKYLCLT